MQRLMHIRYQMYDPGQRERFLGSSVVILLQQLQQPLQLSRGIDGVDCLVRKLVRKRRVDVVPVLMSKHVGKPREYLQSFDPRITEARIAFDDVRPGRGHSESVMCDVDRVSRGARAKNRRVVRMQPQNRIHARLRTWREQAVSQKADRLMPSGVPCKHALVAR